MSYPQRKPVPLATDCSSPTMETNRKREKDAQEPWCMYSCVSVHVCACMWTCWHTCRRQMRKLGILLLTEFRVRWQTNPRNNLVPPPPPPPPALPPISPPSPPHPTPPPQHSGCKGLPSGLALYLDAEGLNSVPHACASSPVTHSLH